MQSIICLPLSKRHLLWNQIQSNQLGTPIDSNVRWQRNHREFRRKCRSCGISHRAILSLILIRIFHDFNIEDLIFKIIIFIINLVVKEVVPEVCHGPSVETIYLALQPVSLSYDLQCLCLAWSSSELSDCHDESDLCFLNGQPGRYPCGHPSSRSRHPRPTVLLQEL